MHYRPRTGLAASCDSASGRPQHLGAIVSLLSKKVSNSYILYNNVKYSAIVHRQRHVNHPPIDHPYKCHENTNHSRVPQLSKGPIPTSK